MTLFYVGYAALIIIFVGMVFTLYRIVFGEKKGNEPPAPEPVADVLAMHGELDLAERLQKNRFVLFEIISDALNDEGDGDPKTEKVLTPEAAMNGLIADFTEKVYFATKYYYEGFTRPGCMCHECQLERRDRRIQRAKIRTILIGFIDTYKVINKAA